VPVRVVRYLLLQRVEVVTCFRLSSKVCLPAFARCTVQFPLKLLTVQLVKLFAENPVEVTCPFPCTEN
jgi:hypothetical protein